MFSTIKVDVAAFNEEEKSKLEGFPNWIKIQKFVDKTIEIPISEFLTYYLFHNIRLGTPDYRDYNTVSWKVHLFLSCIREFIDFEDGSVRTKKHIQKQHNHVTEYVGEAVGLAVMNRIHGLHEADWLPIKEKPGRNGVPSFDYQIASDGVYFVQLEAKGSSVADNSLINQAVRAQKNKIEEKKRKINSVESEHTGIHNSLRYGAITVIDSRQSSNVRCLLTDPPSHRLDETPAKFRLVTRMRNLRDWIAFLSPRSAFAAALTTRLADLIALRDPFELDGVALQGGNSEQFGVKDDFFESFIGSSFMATKSRITEKAAGGIVFQLSERELFFVGIAEALLLLLANQEFDRILSYKYGATTLKTLVNCKFSKGRYSEMLLPDSVSRASKKSGAYVNIELLGEIHYSVAGLVFGIIPLPAN